jgi:hypothetical protein
MYVRFERSCKLLGLHPLVAIVLIVVDNMLFVREGISGPISIVVALALVIPCCLIQKYSFHDNWGLALGKAMIIGILTAIPTPLPSIVIVFLGLVGGAFLAPPTPKKHVRL